MAEHFHIDTDFFVHALSMRGRERKRLQALAASDAVLEMSAVAWYEFCRGPRSPEQIAVARSFFGDTGIVPLTESLSEKSADEFRRLGFPRKRAADIAIGVTARDSGATLLTRNAKDFGGIDGVSLEEA